MRVVLVSDCFLPEINGISFCVKNLAEGLSKKHGVKVIAPDYGGEEGKGVLKAPTRGNDRREILLTKRVCDPRRH